MNLIPSPPQPGQVVRVRQRQYLVDETVPPPEPGDSTLVRLSCMEDDAQGESLEVLWERELDSEILSASDWTRIASHGFDPPKLFAAYFHTLRWSCVTATDPKLFQAPFRAGIRLDAYQLEPLRKALLLPRVNLFIADDVGLGKTIEAGLIARELLLRRKVREIVVAAPPGMLLQWQEELETRFGLSFEILDKAHVARVRQERGWGINPWTTHSRFLVSHRLLIDEDYVAPLRDWLGELRTGSLLILDEAHHAAPASGARYAIDSKITRAVRDLAGRFEHRLFLSATPHNGHSNSFSALLEILDPQRFCRGVTVKGTKLLEAVMVRRLKEDLREVSGGFPRRAVVQEDLDDLPADTPELELSRLLDEYRSIREKRLKGLTRRQRAHAGLLITGLQQRLLSSIEAFARTLRVHRKTVLRQWEEHRADSARTPDPTPQAAGTPDGSLHPYAHDELDLPYADLLGGGVSNDDDRATLPEEELAAEEEAQVEAATLVTTAPPGAAGETQFAQEQALLDSMTQIAQLARGQPDAKVRRLVAWIRQHLCPEPDSGRARNDSARERPPTSWNNRRLLIFTEYDDTKRYLREQLATAFAGTDRAEDRIAVFHGPTPPAERERLKRAFNTDPSRHPLRILIATDAAREGLNLQTHCTDLFHFDLPWNPSRIEQRNGRIDRKLQPSPEVRCHYFFYRQRPEDRVLQVLVKKVERIRQELGSLAQVIESRLERTLKGGIVRAKIDEHVREIDAADIDPETKRVTLEELDESLEEGTAEAKERRNALQGQLTILRTRLSESSQAIAFNEDAFRSAIEASLELLGSGHLASLAPEGGGHGDESASTSSTISETSSPPARWRFPALDQRAGADPSWVRLLDTLRAPRKKDETEWEWRRNAPIRPVVFEDPGILQDEVVHLHLEHRVIQRLLGRFRSQGFVKDDLSRACLAHTKDAIPRVALLGRLAIYGPGAARLHEQLVVVTARWIDPEQRKGALKPHGSDGEARTLELLDEALLSHASRPIAKEIIARLQASASKDIAELLVLLEERGKKLAANARTQLVERARREAEAMEELLKAQKKRIQNTATKLGLPGADPNEFEFMKTWNEAERRQLDANRRHWARRLEAIDGELSTEPARILGFYEVRAERLDPVGLVYLWPVTG